MVTQSRRTLAFVLSAAALCACTSSSNAPNRFAQAPPPPADRGAPSELALPHVATLERARARGVPPVPLRVQRAWANGAGARIGAPTTTYRTADLDQLSYDDLVTTVAGIRWDQITDLFETNADAIVFYKDERRVAALIEAALERSSGRVASRWRRAASRRVPARARANRRQRRRRSSGDAPDE